mmetsp:Transcript_41230/g.133054  ORF Transcript_41230/g.133054 Transcript_41230/m.133054 type:complete len:201 (+) Transcript_41230:248-850(+)
MRKVSPSAPYRLRASVRFVVTPPSPKRRTPLPGATNTSPGVGPSACASSGSTHVPLKKTRPAGSVTSLRAASVGKSRKKRSSPTPGCRVGLTLHAPPVGSTRTVPACPTKEPPPGQQSCRAVRPVMLSSPGKPRSAVSSEKRSWSGSERRAPDEPHSLGIHVPGSRPMLSVQVQSRPASFSASASSPPTRPAWPARSRPL